MDKFEDLIELGFPMFGGKSEIRRIDADTIGPLVDSVDLAMIHEYVMTNVNHDTDHCRGGKYMRGTL